MKLDSYSLGIPLEFPSSFEGTALVLRSVENIPPHIALLHNGFYYSLSVKGVKADIPYQTFYDEMQRLKKSCVLVEIHPPFYIPSPSSTYWNYGPLTGDEGETCLSPIRQWLYEGMDDETGAEIAGAEFVFELIETLQRDGRTGNVFAAYINDGELILPRYTFSDVMNEIKRKEHARANR